MPTASPKPIIFISYSHKDDKWLEFVQGHLQVAVTNGHFETWNDRRIKGGADWAKEIDAALGKCTAFILLVSRYSLVSTFICKKEVRAALNAHSKRGVKIYPIIVEAVEIDAVPWLKKMNIRPRDAKALALYPRAKREKVMVELASEIRDIVKNAPPPPPDKTATSNVPIRSKVSIESKVPIQSNIQIVVPHHFLGRDDALQAIKVALARGEGRVALHGLRGVGKSTLAAAYAERHRGDYRAAWWIRAQTEARADLVALGMRLGWIGADDKEVPALAAVMERLRHEATAFCLYSTMQSAPMRSSLICRAGGPRLRGC
jgi:hypothetical protein